MEVHLHVAPMTHNRSMCNHVLNVSNIKTVQAVGAISELICEAVKDSYVGRSNGT
jgi:hypothetical protein